MKRETALMIIFIISILISILIPQTEFVKYLEVFLFSSSCFLVPIMILCLISNKINNFFK
jgi:purine-cytosine permease-like protein